jgi:hypothetical protein
MAAVMPGAGQDRLARQVHQDGGRIPAGGPTDTAARIVAQKLSDGSASRSSSKTSPAHRADRHRQLYPQPRRRLQPVDVRHAALLAPLMYKTNAYDVKKDFLSVATVYVLPMAIVINPAVVPCAKRCLT